MHVTSEPGILYFGTPVVLISTVNEDGSYNLAPMSSAFWLGWRCILGLAAASKTPQNMMRTGECVLNLPSVDNVAAVNRLARTTGSDPVPEGKVRRGYRFERDKFRVSDLTPVHSDTVAPPRVLQCPVQFEVRVLRVHLEESILMDGQSDRVDPDKWRPLMMSFQKFYGLTADQVHESTLARIPEVLYRGPDIERARNEVKRWAVSSL